MCIKSDAKNGQQYQKWLFAVSEILSKIGIGFISIFKLNFKGWNRPVCHLFGFTRVSTVVAFHPRTRIVTALMPSLPFRLLHLRTLAQEKRSENCFRFGTGGPSFCLYPLLSQNIIFCTALTMAARAKKSETICSRHHWHQRALSGFWARLRILNLIAWLC